VNESKEEDTEETMGGVCNAPHPAEVLLPPDGNTRTNAFAGTEIVKLQVIVVWVEVAAQYTIVPSDTLGTTVVVDEVVDVEDVELTIVLVVKVEDDVVVEDVVDELDELVDEVEKVDVEVDDEEEEVETVCDDVELLVVEIDEQEPEQMFRIVLATPPATK
jgi:hypothetical protein